MNTGYYDKGILVLNRRKIIIKYVTETLLADILSIFPFFYTPGPLKYKMNDLLIIKDFNWPFIRE